MRIVVAGCSVVVVAGVGHESVLRGGLGLRLWLGRGRRTLICVSDLDNVGDERKHTVESDAAKASRAVEELQRDFILHAVYTVETHDA